MNGYVLDTNVVSEIVKTTPDPQVIAFLSVQEDEDLWLPVIVLHELDFGLNLLPKGDQREQLRAALSAVITKYEDRILPVDRAEARQAALLRVRARRVGRVLKLADALIAGTAAVHNLTVATRNVRDFASLNVDFVNPWESS